MKQLVLGILAHVDAGKTTLSEALLYRTGAIRDGANSPSGRRTETGSAHDESSKDACCQPSGNRRVSTHSTQPS